MTTNDGKRGAWDQKAMDIAEELFGHEENWCGSETCLKGCGPKIRQIKKIVGEIARDARREAYERAAEAECCYCRHPDTLGNRLAMKNENGSWLHYFKDQSSLPCFAANIHDLKEAELSRSLIQAGERGL